MRKLRSQPKSIHILISCAVILFAITACTAQEVIPEAVPENTPEVVSSINCKETVAGMSALTTGLRLPDHFDAFSEDEVLKQSGEFDVNRYFKVLPHLSMEDGYYLDYGYEAGGGDGRPFLYSAPDEIQPYKTYSEYMQAVYDSIKNEDENMFYFPELTDRLGDVNDEGFTRTAQFWGYSWDVYINRVTLDGTPDSYFELIVLYLTGSQFYLQWHWLSDDQIVVCDSDDLDIAIDDLLADDFWGIQEGDWQYQQLELMRNIPNDLLEPKVELGKNSATVELAYFTKWGGLILKKFKLNTIPPYQIETIEWEYLVEFEVDIIF